METKICIFGDSIIWGRGLPFRTAWANLLRNYLEKRNRKYPIIELYDLGIDRDTTEELLRRFVAEASARNPHIIIFAVGTNDSSYRKNKNNPLITAKKFENNLMKLVQKARRFTDKIIFIGLGKGSDQKTIPFPGSTTGKCYDKENINIYNNIIKNACRTEKLFFVNVFNKLDDKDFYDGLHPNSKGHQKIFEIVKDFLIENKII